MSEEIKINKLAKSITFINNEIAFSQFGIADEILDLISNLQQENQQLKKQKDDVVEYIKTTTYADITGLEKHNITEFWFIKDLLRMLGEIDVED